MKPYCLQNNIFVLQSGKVVKRPTTPQGKKNYRYIPYDPLNNPTPQDYFRETISTLQKQNSSLKQQLSKNENSVMNPQKNEKEQILGFKKQLAFMKLNLLEKERELQQKNQTIAMKDKMIFDISNENTKLHIRINGVMNEIQTLNRNIRKKEQLIVNKNEEIQEYCQALERMTAREKQQQNTMFSSNYLMTTPRIQQEDEQQQDQFYSLQNSSIHAKTLASKRYMTPEIQTQFDQNYLIDQFSEFKSARNMRMSSQQDIAQGAQFGEIERDGKW